ncbi:MAG: NfeD family protein [Clostridiales bacterium]|nr:NfeD family protein [Clostridiales bacterium]
MWVWIWLGIVVFCMAIEALTMDMVSIWFLLGGIVALILAAAGASVLVQVIVAISISVICLFSFRKFALKLLKKDTTKTNIESTFGKKTKLITAITADSLGTVKVNGLVYNAKSQNDEPIEAGAMVELVEMQGNKYIVREVNK